MIDGDDGLSCQEGIHGVLKFEKKVIILNILVRSWEGMSFTVHSQSWLNSCWDLVNVDIVDALFKLKIGWGKYFSYNNI